MLSCAQARMLLETLFMPVKTLCESDLLYEPGLGFKKNFFKSWVQ